MLKMRFKWYNAHVEGLRERGDRSSLRLRLTGDLSGEGDVLRGGDRLGLLLAGDALLIVIEQKKKDA